MPVAEKTLLQVAARDIGQLTDFEPISAVILTHRCRLQCSNAVPYLLLPYPLVNPVSKIFVAPQFVEERTHDSCGVHLSRERELLEESVLLPIQIEGEANGLRRPGWRSASASWLTRCLG